MKKDRIPDEYTEVYFFVSDALHHRMRALCRPPEKPRAEMTVIEALKIGVGVLKQIQKVQSVVENDSSPEEIQDTDTEKDTEITLGFMVAASGILNDMIEVEKSVAVPDNQWATRIVMPTDMKADLEELASERSHEDIEGLMVDAALAFCLTTEFIQL